MSQAIVWTLFTSALAMLAVWIAYPLFASSLGREEGPSARDEEIDRLIEEKTASYRAMLDLEFDHNLGKVSDPDYAIMRRQHELEAIAILEQLDATSSNEALIDVLEMEIATAKKRLSSGGEESS